VPLFMFTSRSRSASDSSRRESTARAMARSVVESDACPFAGGPTNGDAASPVDQRDTRRVRRNAKRRMRRNLSKPVVRRIRSCILPFAIALAACGRANGDTARGAYVGRHAMRLQPTPIPTVPLHARPELLENSVAVMSRSQPGVFYSMNDSDNEPLVFALDTTGQDRGLWRVTNATNIDWESASLGPCGPTQQAQT